MTELVAQIAAVAGVVSTVVVTLTSLNALSERSRRHKSVERWAEALGQIEDRERRATVERMIGNDIARLIAIRQIPNRRIVASLVGLFTIASIWIMAVFEQADLYFHRVEAPHPIVYLRPPETDALISGFMSVFVIALLATHIYEHRVRRADLYLKSGGYNWSQRPYVHAPTRVFISSFFLMATLLALLWLAANWMHEPSTGPMGGADFVVCSVAQLAFVWCVYRQVVDHYEISRIRREDPKPPAAGTQHAQSLSPPQSEPHPGGGKNRLKLLTIRKP